MPAKLAIKTGAPVMPMYCLRTGVHRYEIVLLPLLFANSDNPHEEFDLTEKINQVFEEIIRKHPEQWNWAHRRWKNQPQNIAVKS